VFTNLRPDWARVSLLCASLDSLDLEREPFCSQPLLGDLGGFGFVLDAEHA
jgi:hypothetical protein